jgi:hypothetical protein
VTQSNKKGGFAALYDVAERKKAEQAQSPPERKEQAASTEKNAHEKSTPRPSPSPTIPNHPQPSPPSSLAPQRDFNKRANSIEREALPQGMFPGSSKKLWDAVYFRTRGAIQPTMEIQATKRDLMAWSGIKNIKTIEAHIRYFVTARLMTRSGENGDAGGYRYGVVMLEEIPTPSPTIPNQHGAAPSLSISNQKTIMEGDQKTVVGGEGKAIDSKETYISPKTSFKTNTERSDDDAALAGLIVTLKNVSEEITGKELSASDGDRWKELAEVLAAELKIAAARTTVSNVPAFLAEHLRRRLWKIDKKQAKAEGRELPDESVSQAQTVDASKCPDCGGSGWWYPDGEAKGVAKCKHEKLIRES